MRILIAEDETIIRLDDVDAPRTIAAQECIDIGGGRSRDCPEGRARAIAREPVEREVACVDRPDELLVEWRGRCAMRIESSNRVVLAHVPERGRPLAVVRRSRFRHRDRTTSRGSGQYRSSTASSCVHQR